MNNTRPPGLRLAFRKQHHDLRHISFLVSPLDQHFLYFASDYLGISQSEFIRRLLFSARGAYCKAELYKFPADLRSLALEMKVRAKARQGKGLQAYQARRATKP